MYIDSPNFVRRRVLSLSKSKKEPQLLEFGKERELLVKHVYHALNRHGKDEEILQNFRRQAEQRKKQRYQAKRRPNNLSHLTPTSSQQMAPAIHNHSITEDVSYEQTTPVEERNHPVKSQQSQYPEMNEMLRHSNELVDRYRKLLNIKEKELKKRDRKIQSSKIAMLKMQCKIKQLQKERKSVEKQEELELSKIQESLKQMNTQIAHNKANVSRQISVLHQELKPSASSGRTSSRDTQISKHFSSPKENLSTPIKPKKQFLSNIKKKALSLRHTNQYEDEHSHQNPSIIYTKSGRTSRNLDILDRPTIPRYPLRKILLPGEES